MKLTIGENNNFFNLISILTLGVIIGTLSSYNSKVAIICALVTLTFLIIFYKFRTSTVVFLLFLLTLIPLINSYGISTAGVNISISDLYILLCVIFLVIFNNSIVKERSKNNFYMPCFTVTIILMIYVPISFFYNTPSEVLNIARNISYSIVTYLIIISISDYISFQKKLKIISLIVSLYTIITYFKIVGETNLYPLFRNAETFHVAMFCYFLISTIFSENNKYTILNWILILLLAVGIIVQQDRIQIIAVFVSIFITFTYLFFKNNKYRKRIALFLTLNGFFVYLIIKIIYIFNVKSIIGLLENYYNYRIKILFNTSGQLQSDTSLSIRSLQYKNIINETSTSIKNIFFGKGLAADYGNGITVVDSFWFWIFLNMGILGLIVFSYYLFTPLIKLVRTKNNLSKDQISIFSAYIGSLIVTISIPNMIMRIDDSVTFGILFALIHLFINEKARR